MQGLVVAPGPLHVPVINAGEEGSSSITRSSNTRNTSTGNSDDNGGGKPPQLVLDSSISSTAGPIEVPYLEVTPPTQVVTTPTSAT